MRVARSSGMPEGLIAEFNARARGEEFAPAAEGDASWNARSSNSKLLSAPLPDSATADDDEGMARAPQARIRADLLDRRRTTRASRHHRARLEQQLGAFRTAMVEMEQTNTRLRDQLRRLDSETEAT